MERERKGGKERGGGERRRNTSRLDAIKEQMRKR